MGATGSMLESGEFKVQNWVTVDYIEGVKVLEPKKGNNNTGLPGRSHTKGTAYILLKDGIFDQLKKYGTDNKPLYDIDYGRHKNKISLHIHYYKNGIKQPETFDVPDELKMKYKKVFKGVPNKWIRLKKKNL
jgi:hypothetical protein